MAGSFLRRAASICLACVALVLGSPSAHALLSEVWVAGNGIDVPACGTVVVPCKTFQYAHNSIITNNGTIYVLRPGSFGPITITKPISIVNQGPGTANIQQTSGNAITINAGLNDSIYLRGLVLDGMDSGAIGIAVNSAGFVQLDDVVVRKFTATGIYVGTSASNESRLSLHAIRVADIGTSAAALASTGFGAPYMPGGCGFHIAGDKFTLHAAIEDSLFENNWSGLCVFGGTAPRITLTMAQSRVHGNRGAGIVTDVSGEAANVLVTLDRVTVTATGIGNSVIVSGNGLFLNGKTVTRISNSTITGNWTGVFTNGYAVTESLGNNVIKGNNTDIGGRLLIGIEGD